MVKILELFLFKELFPYNFESFLNLQVRKGTKINPEIWGGGELGSR